MASRRVSGSVPETPRKTPHCKQCNRPRAGHPRSGCPYTDFSSPAASKHDGLEPKEITDKLNALSITQTPPNADEQEKRQRRRSSGAQKLLVNPTLDSLPSEANDVVEKLLRPGLLDETIPEDKLDVDIPQWRDNLGAPTKTKASSIHDKRSAAQEKRGQVTEIKPLERTLSMEERDNFLGELVKTSLAASVFSLEVDQVEAIQQSARKVGLHARVFTPGEQPQNRRTCWLVLGRDEKAVKKLFDTVRTGSLPEGLQTRCWVAGGAGAVAGALATWTGLALA